MRITDVALYSGSKEGAEELLTFSLSRSEPTALFMVRDMLGLDSEELIPRFYGFSLQNKYKYYDFGMKARTIVLRLVLNPRFGLDESYSDLRDSLYRAISAVRTGVVVLHFNSIGTTVARIYGFITKFEVPYMTPLPEVQMTIRCDDPMFRAIDPVELGPEDLKTTNPIILTDALSTAPHGFQFRVKFKAAISSFTIQDEIVNPEWVFRIVPSGGFLVNDILNFSSDYANKYLSITRGASTIYLVDKIQPESIWPLLFPGSNELYFLDIASFDWLNLEFSAAYWGV